MQQIEKKEQTLNLIKETTKKILFVEGRFNVKTQVIADAAGINRTLINYYFRSRDNLITSVINDFMWIEEEKSAIVCHPDLSFKDKISMYIDKSIILNLQYPYLGIYIFQLNGHELNSARADTVRKLYQGLCKEINEGKIKRTDPLHFILNMESLLIFPNMALKHLLVNNILTDTITIDAISAQIKEVILAQLLKN
jgi:TetR/AcrR family transcriptional regulator